MRMPYCVSTWIGVLVDSSSLGRPTLPLRELYVPAVLDLLLIGVVDLQTRDLINSSMSENSISALLNQHMHAARMTGSTSDILSWFMRTLIPEDSQRSSDLVEPDFLFIWGPYPSREDPSLLVEAKRLRGTGTSLAGDYVDEGVMRFVQGSYGRGHDHGIMMGYVVEAPISSAISRVGSAMDRRKDRTQQCSAFAPNNTLCAYADTHHSTHLQQGTSQSIALVHIFVDFSQSGVNFMRSTQETEQE